KPLTGTPSLPSLSTALVTVRPACPEIATENPSAASPRAIDSPMPRVPPVTNATRSGRPIARIVTEGRLLFEAVRMSRSDDAGEDGEPETRFGDRGWEREKTLDFSCLRIPAPRFSVFGQTS